MVGELTHTHTDAAPKTYTAADALPLVVRHCLERALRTCLPAHREGACVLRVYIYWLLFRKPPCAIIHRRHVTPCVVYSAAWRTTLPFKDTGRGPDTRQRTRKHRPSTSASDSSTAAVITQRHKELSAKRHRTGATKGAAAPALTQPVPRPRTLLYMYHRNPTGNRMRAIIPT